MFINADRKGWFVTGALAIINQILVSKVMLWKIVSKVIDLDIKTWYIKSIKRNER